MFLAMAQIPIRGSALPSVGQTEASPTHLVLSIRRCSAGRRSKQRLARNVGDPDHGGMLESPFDRDGIKPLLDPLDATDDPHPVLPANLLFDGCWRCKHAFAVLPENLQDGTVLKLVDDVRSDIGRVKPLFERSAQ